jgi:membrane dipeptidase
MTVPIQVFDGHNDVLLRLQRRAGTDAERVTTFLDGGDAGHLDLPKAVTGGFAGGLFAMFVPSSESGLPPTLTNSAEAAKADANVPLPPELELGDAQRATLHMTALLFEIARRSGDRVRVCRSVADIRAAQKDGALATVLHIEGAEAIDPDLHMLDVLHAAGLRSLGPVWSRTNIFAHGVPFRFPSPPDIGPGLTERGRALVTRCNQLGILIDLSHMNEAGFWDIARLSSAPLVATHSNAHTICQASRNLTDKQLAAIRESRGLVGVNFASAFLRKDGRREAATSLDIVVDHIAYLVDTLGEDGVAIGSDFDGAVIPNEIGDARGLPRLTDRMLARGFGHELVIRIAFENWMRILDTTWSAGRST